MATLSTKNSNSSVRASSSEATQNRVRGFRIRGTVTDFVRGVTKATETRPSQPYVKCKINGTTTTGKNINGTIMAFGEKNITNLDVNEQTKTAGVFVAYDRNSHSRNVLVPVGPYKS